MENMGSRDRGWASSSKGYQTTAKVEDHGRSSLVAPGDEQLHQPCLLSTKQGTNFHTGFNMPGLAKKRCPKGKDHCILGNQRCCAQWKKCTAGKSLNGKNEGVCGRVCVGGVVVVFFFSLFLLIHNPKLLISGSQVLLTILSWHLSCHSSV